MNEDDATGSTRRNALHQLYSLARLGQIFADMDPASYDLVILLRPDLRYLDPLPLAQCLAQLRRREAQGRPRIGGAIAYLRRHGRERADIIMPSWQRWGGLNDRFAIAIPQAAAIYMNRITNLADFCAARSYFHPESLLDFSMRRAGLITAATWVRAQRIRTDGTIAALDIPDGRANFSLAIKHKLRRFAQI